MTRKNNQYLIAVSAIFQTADPSKNSPKFTLFNSFLFDCSNAISAFTSSFVTYFYNLPPFIIVPFSLFSLGASLYYFSRKQVKFDANTTVVDTQKQSVEGEKKLPVESEKKLPVESEKKLPVEDEKKLPVDTQNSSTQNSSTQNSSTQITSHKHNRMNRDELENLNFPTLELAKNHRFHFDFKARFKDIVGKLDKQPDTQLAIENLQTKMLTDAFTEFATYFTSALRANLISRDQFNYYKLMLCQSADQEIRRCNQKLFCVFDYTSTYNYECYLRDNFSSKAEHKALDDIKNLCKMYDNFSKKLASNIEIQQCFKVLTDFETRFSKARNIFREIYYYHDGFAYDSYMWLNEFREFISYEEHKHRQRFIHNTNLEHDFKKAAQAFLDEQTFYYPKLNAAIIRSFHQEIDKTIIQILDYQKNVRMRYTNHFFRNKQDPTWIEAHSLKGLKDLKCPIQNDLVYFPRTHSKFDSACIPNIRYSEIKGSIVTSITESL